MAEVPRMVADPLPQDALDTPDYTVGTSPINAPATSPRTNSSLQDTEPGADTTESSIAGDVQDGRKRRWEGNALRKSVLGKKHDRLGESKVYTQNNLPRHATRLTPILGR